jgi:hypothetical protein
MIQGCRYLRRSTDRWFLSKNSTTRLEGLKVGTGPVCCEIVRSSLLQTLRVHIYTLVLTRLLIDYEYNIHCLKQCSGAGVHLAPVINSSLPYIQATSSRIPEYFLFQAQNSPFTILVACSRPQAPLPNASRKTSCRMVPSYQTRPTSQTLSCTNFWC